MNRNKQIYIYVYFCVNNIYKQYICKQHIYKHVYVHICSYTMAFINGLSGCHPSSRVCKTNCVFAMCGIVAWKLIFWSTLKRAKKEKVRTEFIMAQQKDTRSTRGFNWACLCHGSGVLPWALRSCWEVKVWIPLERLSYLLCSAIVYIWNL